MSESTTHETPSKDDDNNNNNNNNNKKDPKYYTKEDLIELVRAIKFSQPDASMRVVHTEITTKMSQNESFEFLQDVKLNDVKKIWKKAITGGGGASNTSGASGSSDGGNSIANAKRMLLEGTTAIKDEDDVVKSSSANENADKRKESSSSKGKKNEILKFYTVGDGSVQTLAKNYTLQAAANAVAQENAFVEEQNEEEMKKYVSCFLDVPADRSGGKPHQGEQEYKTNHNVHLKYTHVDSSPSLTQKPFHLESK